MKTEAGMTTKTRFTWLDLAALPLASNRLAEIVRGRPDLTRPATWRHLSGPLALRQALGLSLAGMGQLLSEHDPRRRYSRSAIHGWERVERGLPADRRYRMTPATRAVYQHVAEEAARLATGGRLRGRWGARVWRVELVQACSACGREFAPRDARQKRCRWCSRD